MHTLLIADDHAVIREGLRQIIAGMSDMKVVGEAADGQQVLDQLRRLKVDLLLLDISMPGRSGLDILKQLKSSYPKLSILVLSQHPEDQYARRVLQAGASGYLTKESTSKELAMALRKVASGGKYVSASLAENLVSQLDGAAGQPEQRLSDREYEVLHKIGNGKTVSEVALELSLSVKTISTYRARILEKMNLRTTAELIRYVIEKRLKPPPVPSKVRPKTWKRSPASAR